MTDPRLHHVQCLDATGLHRMAYWEWGARDNPRVLVCVHGLSRQGRDFDTLAQAMLPDWRVVCPDVVGRGQSDWLRDPNGYTLATYVADMVTLLARLDATQVDWVGTSMGGLIGMLLAALPGAPVRRLVLNDVGPIVQFQALQRIGQYLGFPVRWKSEQEAADALWTIASSFGPHTPEQWLALTRPQLRDDGQGGFKPHYDPDIAVPFRAVTAESAQAGEAQLWKAYDALRSQTLLVRGAESDLLSRDTAIEMTQRGPRARLVEFEGVGHAPTLVQPDQVAAVRDFLLAA
jgi:pimeloyl-ACP methyl ester carboxylesterase